MLHSAATIHWLGVNGLEVMRITMPRQVSATTVQVLVALSVLLLTAQLLLLFCQCRCGTLDDISSITDAEAKKGSVRHCCRFNYTESTVLELKETIKTLERKLNILGKLDKVLISQDISYLKRQIQYQGLQTYVAKNEYDVIPFDSFTLSTIYGDISSLSKNPAEAVSGRRSIEHSEVIRFAVKAFREDVESKSDPVLPIHLTEGITRNDRLIGTVYELHFRSDIPDVFKRIRVVRPFGALETLGMPETIDTSKQLINVIVPLSGRLHKFREFMTRFLEVGIRYDRRVFLTVIFFGAEGREEIRETLQKISTAEKFTDYKVIFTDQQFSRGAALQKGAESWLGGNVLMFFCDVDIYFTVDFLERCRLYTSPGRRVYYPIVYSQYNPIIVYGGQAIPPLQHQMKLNKDSGFWRDFGFGMTCQYRHDFLKVGGFDLSIKGWGMEDVRLYRKYLQSDLEVVRAYDRNIFHIYHEKKCAKTLSDDQFISCLQSKAVSEGNHKQMGMLAFGKYLLGNDHPDWAKLLESSLTGAVEQANTGDSSPASHVLNQTHHSAHQHATTSKEGHPTSKIANGHISQEPVMADTKQKGISLTLAKDIMMHAHKLKSLHDELNARLNDHPQKEKFKSAMDQFISLQRSLETEANSMLEEFDKKWQTNTL